MLFIRLITNMLLFTRTEIPASVRRRTNKVNAHSAHTTRSSALPLFWGRRRWLIGIFSILTLILLSRAVWLQIMHKDFLQDQGDARYLRTVTLLSHRGILKDRHGMPLAISTPVDSVWVHPGRFLEDRDQWPALARQLGMPISALYKIVKDREKREFIYLKRHLPPDQAQRVMVLNLQGVGLQREYRRYYPHADVTAHLLGFTDIDEHGQEGLELALNRVLAGEDGAKQVIQGKHGEIIEELGYIHHPVAGQDMTLTLDLRLQYLVYRVLHEAVNQHKAEAASALVMDVREGDVLAMVNYPAYNPNNREELSGPHLRNRTVTDVFEPGSTIKPFTIAAALESRRYTPETLVNTSPGILQLGKYQVRDARNYGQIDVSTVLQKSSNVGASKIALSLLPEVLRDMLAQAGFGQVTGSGFPGEVNGRVPHIVDWDATTHATLSYGYGLSVTLLQLTRAYAALGNKGRLPSVRFVVTDARTEAKSIMREETAAQILQMLERAVTSGGTGVRAQVPYYRIAGKTGTVRKAAKGGYSKQYLSLFVGLAPASAPQLAMAVLIDSSKDGSYYGGEVAAPVFGHIMQGALQLLNVPPDNLPAQ